MAISNKSLGKWGRPERPISDLAWRTLDSLAAPTVILNSEYRVCYVNPAAEQILQASLGTLLGKYWSEVLRFFHDERLVDVIAEYKLVHCTSLPADDVWYFLQRANEEQIPVRISIANIYDSDSIHHAGVSIVIHEVARLKLFFDQLAHKSMHDALTGVVNRSELEKRVLRLVKNNRNETNENHALLFLDLDGFKAVNDEYGHQAGDAILCHVARLFNAIVRERDTVARYGGDEFVLLLEHCSVKNAIETARMLRVMLKDYAPTWRGKRVNIDVSVGIVGFDKDMSDLSAIVAKADEACYQAKRSTGEKIWTYHFNQKQKGL